MCVYPKFTFRSGLPRHVFSYFFQEQKMCFTYFRNPSACLMNANFVKISVFFKQVVKYRVPQSILNQNNLPAFEKGFCLFRHFKLQTIGLPTPLWFPSISQVAIMDHSTNAYKQKSYELQYCHCYTCTPSQNNLKRFYTCQQKQRKYNSLQGCFQVLKYTHFSPLLLA